MEAYCKCAKCGGQAKVDTSNVLTSFPPKYNYTCAECGYHGYVETSEVSPINSLGNSGIFGGSNIRGITAYPSYPRDNSCSCSGCSHKEVCKFREEYEKKIAEINFTPDAFMRIKVECIYYTASPLNISYLTRDINDFNKSTTSSPCATCDFAKKLATEGSYIGDSPCDWCSSNPYKLTCSPLTSINATTSAKTKTIINETMSNTNKTEEKQ